MSRLSRRFAAPMVLFAAAGLSLAGPPEEGVTLTPVTFDAFRAKLAKNPTKAKFTIVDAWSTVCGPCKENFPHLVAMNTKYASKGLAVASLTLDDRDDKKAVAEALRFLKAQKATFSNYLMDEEAGVGFDKLNINAIPAVFLFGPDGKEIRRFTMDDPDNQFTYDEVELAVASLLEGKPLPAPKSKK